MAQGVRQQLRTIEVRPEIGVARRFGEWDGQECYCSVFCPYTPGAMASFTACDIKLLHQVFPTTTLGWHDLQNSQPVPT
jgi:hypothetical protein